MYTDNSTVANRPEAARLSGVTYLTTDELSTRIKYDARTIRERLKDSVLLEGVHLPVHNCYAKLFHPSV